MKKIQKEIIIPEQTAYKTVYVANDGTEFISEIACKKHEFKQVAEKSTVWKSRITSMDDFFTSQPAQLFYIASQDDYDSIVSLMEIKPLPENQHKFANYGDGWYIYWHEEVDYDDYDYLFKLDNYIKNIDMEWSKWKERLRKNISAKEKENICQTAIH